MDSLVTNFLADTRDLDFKSFLGGMVRDRSQKVSSVIFGSFDASLFIQ